jgi:CheY-like chemotaxis protein
MAAEPIHILLVEDDPENVRTIWNMLHEKSRLHYFIEAVTGVSEALKRLTTGDIDVVLLDLSLVSHQVETNAIQAILETQSQLAHLVLTELENEQAGLRALEAAG